MSTIYVALCQVEVKLKFSYLLSYTYVQLQTLCLRQVGTIVLGQVVTTVTTLGRFVPMAQPASCYNCNNARAARTDGSASELLQL